MNRKLVFYLGMLVLFSSACAKNDNKPFLTLSKTADIVCSSSACEQNLLLSSSHSWTVSNSEEWCKVSHADRNNSAGNDILVLFKIEENKGFSQRESLVTFVSSKGDISQSITIRQNGQSDAAPRMTSFGFREADNLLQLSTDIFGDISEDHISIFVPHILPGKLLIPEFTFSGLQVTVNGDIQESGYSIVDFSTPVEYLVSNESGAIKKYTITVSSFTGLPIVFINTENDAQIVSKDDYVNATIRIIENSVVTAEHEVGIKGRGNSTWTLPKKPYKMKFATKTSLLGRPADKEWVLLANYTDKTALRNETAFFMGRLSQLDWVPSTHFVEVFINEVYNGTYQLCDQIKIADDRVNVTDDGYLLEVDQLSRMEPGDVYFETDRLLFNIKDPDVDYGSERYDWIKDYVANVENLLYAENFDAETGYAQYIDMPSFVDWYLINEITKNNDSVMFSSCYLHIAPGGKLKMGPLWDFDIALGNDYENGNYDPTGFWVAQAHWFNQLLKDPIFIAEVKNRFAYFYSKKEEIFANINSNAEYLKWSVVENNNRWGTFYNKTWPNYAVWGNYDNEVQYLKNWLNTRFEWLQQEFDKM